MRAHYTPRLLMAPVFLAALGWAFESTIPSIHPVLTTEEGQQVVFDRFTWQHRELAKKLPVSEPWPSGRDMRDVLKRYGLAENASPDGIPVPARITSDV